MKRLLPILLILILLIVIKNNISYILQFLEHGSPAQNLKKLLSEEEKRNKFLKERLYYVKTNEFVSEEATEKLGMLKNEEYFVIAPTSTPLNNARIEYDTKPNWRKWLDLFF